MSASSPTLLFGGIRTTIIDLRGLQAELARSSDQTEENLQTANAFSGSTVTNTLTQSETENQQGSSLVTQTVTVDPPAPVVVPPKFLDNFEYYQRLEHQANAINFLSRGQADTTQTQRVGQNAYADGASPSAGDKSDAVNTLVQTATNLQTLSQAGINTSFTALTGTLPIVVAREREISVALDGMSAEGLINTSQIQGAAPTAAQSPGAAEALKSTSPFLTTTGPATAATDLNDLQGGSGAYQPGVDTILISGTGKNGSPITPATFTYGDPVAGVNEVVRAASPLAMSSGNATTATALNDLTANTTDYVPGDAIDITGTDFGGAAASASFKFGTVGGANQTLTSGAIASNDPTKASPTVTDQNTKLRYLGGTGDAAYAAYESGPPSTISITGTDLNGASVSADYQVFDKDLATLGHLIDFLNGSGVVPAGDTVNNYSTDRIPGATVSLDGSGQLVLTADSGSAASNLSLSISNGTLTNSATGFSWPSFAQTAAGADADSNGTTVGDLIGFVNGSGSGVDGTTDKLPGSTLSLSSGTLELQADTAGEATLAFSLADQGTAKTSWPSFSETTAGVTPITGGDGATLGDLVGKISAAFSNATATIDSAGKIVLTADQVGSATLSLALSDGAGSANRGFAGNAFVEETAGDEPISGSILSGTSFQIGRANQANATNTLTETATHTLVNNVANTHTVDVRRIAGTSSGQAPLTPRSMDIIIRMNETTGELSRVSNVGHAVQNQALVQTGEGGMDQDGNPTDTGGSVLNTGTQTATTDENTTVSQNVQVQA